MVYSGHEIEKHGHTEGVAFMISKPAAKALIDWVPVSPWIITARFNSKGRKVTLTISYAPTNNSTDELKKEFHDSLQGVLGTLMPKLAQTTLEERGSWGARD